MFAKTLELHKEKVHINPSLDTSVSSLSDIISSELGQNITLAIDNAVVKKPAAETSKSKTPRVSLSGGKKRKRASKCGECGLLTTDHPLLLSHRMLEHGVKLVPVHYCGYNGCWFPFGTRAEKLDHEKNRHGSVMDAFVCIICKKRYPTRSHQYVAHVKSCAKKTVYKCPCGPPCSFETRRYGVIRRHVKSVHNKLLDSFPKSSYEVKSQFVGHGEETVQDEEEEDEIKQEPVDVKPPTDDLAESSNAEQLNQEHDKKDDDVILCPFDSRKFSKIPDLHKHIHNHHLDIGDDSIDCPFCEEVWTCFCGRQINNRDSLVLHSLRCEVIRTSDRSSQALTTVSDTGSLRAKRRAAKKFKELGFKDKISWDEVLKSDQMKMVESISQSPKSIETKTEPQTEHAKEEEVIDIVSDSDSDDNPVLNLSPAKRKSKKTSMSSIFAKCRECDKVYHKTMIAAHECSESESESEGIVELSD